MLLASVISKGDSMRYCRQETFDKVVLNLRRQGRRSADDNHCVYRAPNGDRCAAGWLIPDSDYEPGMEGETVLDGDDLSRVGSLIKKLGHDVRLVARLQTIHDLCPKDSNGSLPLWEEKWRFLARRMGLVYTDAAGVSHF